MRSQLPAGAADAILVIEDYADDAKVLEVLFHQLMVWNPIQILHSATDAIAYLTGLLPYSNRTRHPLPAVILLDLKLPGMDGFEFLEWLCEHPEFNDVLVVAVSGLDDLASIRRAYTLGADSFLAKPCRAADLENLIQWFPGYWLRPTSVVSFS